jgi:chromate transporter
MDEAPTAPAARPSQAGAVFLAFLRQGLSAFGGPMAHVAAFRREFVERRGWLGEDAFADLLALCQFLPGPTSSQLAMVIGLRRAGALGLGAALAGFALPASAAMVALAYLLPWLGEVAGDGWRHGLKIAAAAVVAQALSILARTLARGPIRIGMAIGAGVGLTLAPVSYAHGPVVQVFVLLAGAGFGWALLKDEPAPEAPSSKPMARPSLAWAAGCLCAFVLLLGALPFLAAALGQPLLGLASVFYRVGALAFGGDHMLLPLLRTEVLGRGWLDRDSFVTGYGALQALPGPLFAFGGYLGAAQAGWLGGLVALLAVFLPGLLLAMGVLPFWNELKRRPQARGVIAGLSAVMVGLLAAAFWNPVLTSAVRRPSDWALVAAAYIFLTIAKLPAWLVVIGFAAATTFIVH